MSETLVSKWLDIANGATHLRCFPVRSSRLGVFCKKGALRNFIKFTRKHPCQSLFFNKVADLRPATLLKKRLWHKCLPVNFVKFLRTAFLTEHLWWLLLSSQIRNAHVLCSSSKKGVVWFIIISTIAVTTHISTNNFRTDLFLKGIFLTYQRMGFTWWPKITLSLQKFKLLSVELTIWVLSCCDFFQ